MTIKREALALRRERAGHTQESLAACLRVAASTVARWELGLVRPQPRVRPALAQELNVSLDELDVLLAARAIDQPPPADVGSGQAIQTAPPIAIGPFGHEPRTQGIVAETTPVAAGSTAPTVTDMAVPISGEEVEDTDRRDALKLGMAAYAVPETVERVLGRSAAEALEFTRRVGCSNIGHGTFDHLEMVATRLDRSYSKEPPADLFAMARSYRNRIARLLEKRHTLRQARELYVYAAWFSESLAWLAHDLGNSIAADAYAVDCYEHADQAGHDELCAWAADAMASIALYGDQPERAARVANKGVGKAPTNHPLAVRLRAQAARAYARLGDRRRCEDMLREAQFYYDQLPGRTPRRHVVDTLPLATFAITAYPASCYIWLGDFTTAKTYASEAVTAFETAPIENRSPSRESIARIDLGIALAELGSPDEAAALGGQAICSPRVVASVRSRCGELDQVLTTRYPDVPEVRDFHDQYRITVRAAITP